MNLKFRLNPHYPIKGVQWLYSHNGHTLSIIISEISYGGKEGLFEIMPSWRQPEKHDTVKGYLTFAEVQKWIDELKKQKRAGRKNEWRD